MLSFSPSVQMQKRLKELHSRVVEAANELETATAEEKQYLNNCALISNVGATTRIENAVLTDVEIEWVDTLLSTEAKPTAFEQNKTIIFDKLSKERQRSIEEVAGSRNVLTSIYLQAIEFKPLRESDIRALHKELLKFYLPAEYYAGEYKTITNKVIARDNVTGNERTVLEPTEPGVMTQIAMQELLSWYNKVNVEQPWSILVATEFVFRFLAIHPFQDGNGRIGRALFLLVLLQSDDEYMRKVVRYVSIDRKIEQHKQQYYSVLHSASDGKYRTDPKQYKYTEITLFFISMFIASLDDIKLYRNKFKNLNALSESVSKVLESFKENPERQLKVSEIEIVTNLPRRTIQFALRTLDEKKFIQRLGKGAGSRYQLVF